MNYLKFPKIFIFVVYLTLVNCKTTQLYEGPRLSNEQVATLTVIYDVLTVFKIDDRNFNVDSPKLFQKYKLLPGVHHISIKGASRGQLPGPGCFLIYGEWEITVNMLEGNKYNLQFEKIGKTESYRGGSESDVTVFIENMQTK